MLFFWNFLFRVGLERNGTIIFIFLILGIFQPIFAWNKAIMVYFNFLNFFAFVFEFSITRRVGTKRNDDYYFLHFLFFIKPILAWKEYITVFFIFLNFFVIFLEFSVTRRVGTKRNDNFYFLSFSSFSNLFWLEMNHNGIF